MTEHKQAILVETEEDKVEHLICGVCALWWQKQEDSVSQDYGLCPRRVYPDNITHHNDGCMEGIRPKE